MLLPSIFGDDFFDDFLSFPYSGRQTRRAETGRTVMGMMHTDIKETEDGYQLDIDLPGFRKEDVKAQLKEGYLTVTATRDDKDEEKKHGRDIRRERYMGTVTRSFYVGEQLTEADIKARFEDGILKIAHPKKDQKKVEENRFIEIEG